MTDLQNLTLTTCLFLRPNPTLAPRPTPWNFQRWFFSSWILLTSCLFLRPKPALAPKDAPTSRRFRPSPTLAPAPTPLIVPNFHRFHIHRLTTSRLGFLSASAGAASASRLLRPNPTLAPRPTPWNFQRCLIFFFKFGHSQVVSSCDPSQHWRRDLHQPGVSFFRVLR